MNKGSIWIAIIHNKNAVFFVKSFPTQQEAESAIIDYFERKVIFHADSFPEICEWIQNNDIPLDVHTFGIQVSYDKRLILKEEPIQKAEQRGICNIIYRVNIITDELTTITELAFREIKNSNAISLVIFTKYPDGKTVMADLYAN